MQQRTVISCSLAAVCSCSASCAQLTKYNERPLYLLMDPTSNNGKTLPLTLYEERTHVVGDHTTSEFVRAEYTVQADEAERITVTHCAKVVNQEETGSAGQCMHISCCARRFLASRLARAAIRSECCYPSDAPLYLSSHSRLNCAVPFVCGVSLQLCLTTRR
jgi:hypothetical protein